ncbi:MAG TPA: hypothetical protein VMQ54_00965 [Steroidobacteraceae bacterium]|nr:hypothetical protein [Steroidobacteraceae bacterium]
MLEPLTEGLSRTRVFAGRQSAGEGGRERGAEKRRTTACERLSILVDLVPNPRGILDAGHIAVFDG